MDKHEIVEQELISIPFGNSKIDALFYRSLINAGKPEKEPVIIHIHGFLGNFLEGSQRYLPPILAEAGYSSLSINTRMATFGLFFGYGIIDDTIPQIDTAIVYLKNMGYSKIILSGYSLGSSIVLRYASLRNDPSVFTSLKGIIALSTPYSTPQTIRKRWNKWGSNPSYDEIHRRVMEALKPDPHRSPEDRTVIIYKARGDTLNPEHTELYTFKTWWYLAGPEAEAAKCFKHISKISISLLLIQGRKDDELGPDEANKLMEIAQQAGNKDVTAFYLDANHDFDGKEQELGEVIKKWLDKRFSHIQPNR
ncbi:MAG: alpha/beta hydrolase family protein [Thermodesulfobacteriota bacterium]